MIEVRNCRYCGQEVTKNESRSFSNGSWQHLNCEPGRRAKTCSCDLPLYLDAEGKPTAQEICEQFEADDSSLFCKHCEHAQLCHGPIPHPQQPRATK